VSKRDRPKLPIFAIGAVALHLIALGLLLPLLITLPGPGSETPPRPVNIEVDIGSPAPRPTVPDVSSISPAADDETSALPTDSESNGETRDALAKVAPETEPASEEEDKVTPAEIEPAAGAHERKAKPKVEAKGAPKVAKPAPKVVRASAQKKSLFARGKSSKLFLGGRTASTNAQGSSWSALLNAPH
jgi:hypothetical protein